MSSLETGYKCTALIYSYCTAAEFENLTSCPVTGCARAPELGICMPLVAHHVKQLKTMWWIKIRLWLQSCARLFRSKSYWVQWDIFQKMHALNWVNLSFCFKIGCTNCNLFCRSFYTSPPPHPTHILPQDLKDVFYLFLI